MPKSKAFSVLALPKLRLPKTESDWKFQRVCATCNDSLPLGMFNKGKRSCRGCTRLRDRQRNRKTTGRGFTRGEKKEPKPQNIAVSLLIEKAMEAGKLYSLCINKKVPWKAYYVTLMQVEKMREPIDRTCGYNIGVSKEGIEE